MAEYNVKFSSAKKITGDFKISEDNINFYRERGRLLKHY